MTLQLPVPTNIESFCYGIAFISSIIICYTIYILCNYELVLFPKYKQID